MNINVAFTEKEAHTLNGLLLYLETAKSNWYEEDDPLYSSRIKIEKAIKEAE